ncbi:recombinase family protein [Xanthomonas sacchari]|uniref:recombinase family protein n=1 Tax=Xanthomonas sacchari TaxID=56458 RepID=UPI002253BB4C|nr:recombinase family protein [Xanthomonas sacchari]
MVGSVATKARVYSCLRFFDPKQATGSSVDRQLDYAKRWAAERGMTLDSELSMQDACLSAYHQRHVTKGAFGVFLAAIDEGRIPSGSVLVVEGLDRLSRAVPSRSWPRPSRRRSSMQASPSSPPATDASTTASA